MPKNALPLPANTLEELQHPTPEVMVWVAAQAAGGCSRQQVFAALREASWQPQSAALVMRLTPSERQALGVLPAGGDLALPPTAAVPQPAYLCQPHATGGLCVKAGDQTVAVLERLETPAITVFTQLLSRDECNALIAAARPRLSASLTVDTQTGGQTLHPDRTSQGMFFVRAETALIARIEARIAALLSWPLDRGEGLQVVRYPTGAQYKPHYDYFEPNEPGTPAIVARGGQRVATLIIYLHTPDGGGATLFPQVGVSVTPLRGNAVFFSYGLAHPASLSLHGGAAVTQGEKWIATKWLRERPFN